MLPGLGQRSLVRDHVFEPALFQGTRVGQTVAHRHRRAHQTPARRGPVSSERLPARRTWIEHDDHVAEGFAACRFLESIGSGVSAPTAVTAHQLHDELCQARAELPIA